MSKKPIYTDPILEELWRIKETHAAKYGYDVRAMLRAMREKQEEDEKRGVKFVSLPPRRIRKTDP